MLAEPQRSLAAIFSSVMLSLEFGNSSAYIVHVTWSFSYKLHLQAQLEFLCKIFLEGRVGVWVVNLSPESL